MPQLTALLSNRISLVRLVPLTILTVLPHQFLLLLSLPHPLLTTLTLHLPLSRHRLQLEDLLLTPIPLPFRIPTLQLQLQPTTLTLLLPLRTSAFLPRILTARNLPRWALLPRTQLLSLQLSLRKPKELSTTLMRQLVLLDPVYLLLPPFAKLLPISQIDNQFPLPPLLHRDQNLNTDGTMRQYCLASRPPLLELPQLRRRCKQSRVLSRTCLLHQRLLTELTTVNQVRTYLPLLQVEVRIELPRRQCSLQELPLLL